MSSQLAATFVAIGLARKGRALSPLIAALALAGCQPAAPRLATADPAAPAADVPSVRYRSTIAPYARLRPASPVPWRERNDDVAPQPRQKQQ